MNATALRICGHTAAEHADPAIGDTRCLVIGERAQLEHVFDDGRDTFPRLLRLPAVHAQRLWPPPAGGLWALGAATTM